MAEKISIIEERKRKSEYMRKWNAAHREKVREDKREYGKRVYADNPEIQAERSRRWYETHKEAALEKRRGYKKEHPEKARENKLRRRANKSNTIVSLTHAQEIEILAVGCFFSDETCAGPLSIAHDVPVSKGGNTTRANTFCLCRKHNSAMGTKTLPQKIKQLFFM